MADERIPITYSLNPTTKEISRKKGKGDEIIEDKVVAKYDPESQTLEFPNTNFRRLYKVGCITFLAENEMNIRAYAQQDMPADKPTTKSTPPRPKKDKANGDKTLAVAQWYWDNKPTEFKVRYGFLGYYSGKVTILEPQWVERPVDRQLEYRGVARVERTVSQAMVAERQVCGINGERLTYIPDECVDYDGEEPDAISEEEERGVLKGRREQEGGDE